MHLCYYFEIRINCVHYGICYLQEILFLFLFFELWTFRWKFNSYEVKQIWSFWLDILVMRCNKSGLLGWYLGYEVQQRSGLWDQSLKVLIENCKLFGVQNIGIFCVWTFQLVIYNVTIDFIHPTINLVQVIKFSIKSFFCIHQSFESQEQNLSLNINQHWPSIHWM